MSVEVTLDVKGVRELKNKITSLNRGMQKQIYHQLHRLGSSINNLAKQLAPVRTGRLRSSIYSKVKDWTLIVGAKVPYACYVEFGTRYIRPRRFLTRAIKTYLPQLQILVNEGIKQAIAEASP